MIIMINIIISILFLFCIGCLKSQDQHHEKHEIVHFGRYKLHHTRWKEVKQLVDCWGGPGGSWEFQNITIIDDIFLYTPCPIQYSIKNPCAWILDNNSLKYKWEPNYEKNNKVETW